MKLNRFLFVALIPLLVAGCRRGGDRSTTPIDNSDSSSVTSNSSQSGTSGDISSTSGVSNSSGSGDTGVDYIALSSSSLLMQVGETTGSSDNLSVSFLPDGASDEEKEGEWASSNEDVATVRYGRVTAVAKGTAVISYTTTIGHHSAYCTVTVVNSKSDIKREYVRVTDMDSIAVGDTIIFARKDTEMNVAMSYERNNRYLLTESASFSGDGSKLLEPGGTIASYFVGEGKYEGSFTLENQNGEYLVGEQTTVDTTLDHIKSLKGQVSWFFEHSNETGLDYCYNANIEDDLWIMFNKISGEVKTRLYDSNETTLMKLPHIYRLTITEIN